MNNMWKSAIWGVIVGDALGTPVQFESRAQVAHAPVKGMIGYRTFNTPPGTWTDDSALTLATFESIKRTEKIVPADIMDNFVKWLEDGKFTPFGYAFDIGHGTMRAIKRYERTHDVATCGGSAEGDNGNGSLMRIMPAVLYCIEHKIPDDAAIEAIHAVSALTHAHDRSKIACGLYYFMAKAITMMDGSLNDRLRTGLELGLWYYKTHGYDTNAYSRLRGFEEFKALKAPAIRSTGYVVDTLEAAVWGLANTKDYKTAMLKIVNLGDDTDSIAAVAGGLAGLYYGYEAIPANWLAVIQRRDWIDAMIAN